MIQFLVHLHFILWALHQDVETVTWIGDYENDGDYAEDSTRESSILILAIWEE